MTDAQKRAKAKYAKAKVTRIAVDFYPTETALLDHVKAQPSSATYIKNLIREDMKK